MEQRETAVRAWARPLVLLPAFALVSLVGGALPSFSLGANLLVPAAGGALGWLTAFWGLVRW